jgi:DNA-binding response OmpR family regulator
MAAYRVLVVEDNPQVRRMVTASIKTLGADIDVLDVPSAEEALFISSSLPLDLVVLDYRLPGMTGLEMVTRLQKRRPEAKIILVTGVEDATTRQQVAEADVEAFFYKPIHIDTFLEVVKRSLWSDRGEQNQPLNNQEPAISSPVGITLPTPEVKPSSPQSFRLSLDERLTALKQQLKAVSALLVNNEGQVLEVAGNPSQITTGSVLLSALITAYKASQQVSEAMSRGTSSSLQYFTAHRQVLYVVTVGHNHALFVLTSGYFEPDKLSAINHTLQVAARDLQTILANQLAEEQAKQDKSSQLQTELPKDVTVDQETLAGVEKLFAGAAETSTKERADGFWEALEASDALEGVHGKDVISYDQARDLGLAPHEEEEP